LTKCYGGADETFDEKQFAMNQIGKSVRETFALGNDLDFVAVPSGLRSVASVRLLTVGPRLIPLSGNVRQVQPWTV
jgi:hypothetical protein